MRIEPSPYTKETWEAIKVIYREIQEAIKVTCRGIQRYWRRGHER